MSMNVKVPTVKPTVSDTAIGRAQKELIMLESSDSCAADVVAIAS